MYGLGGLIVLLFSFLSDLFISLLDLIFKVPLFSHVCKQYLIAFLDFFLVFVAGQCCIGDGCE